MFEITVLFSVVLSHHRQMGLVPQGYKETVVVLILFLKKTVISYIQTLKPEVDLKHNFTIIKEMGLFAFPSLTDSCIFLCNTSHIPET